MNDDGSNVCPEVIVLTSDCNMVLVSKVGGTGLRSLRGYGMALPERIGKVDGRRFR